MARGKKIKTGGKSRGTPRHSRPSSLPNSFVRASNAWSPHESDFVPATSFSLHDAARNHSERPSAWSSQTNLRHKGLQFVRASEGLKGTLETDKDSAKLDSANPAVSCNPAVPDVQQSIPPISPLPIRASTTQDAAATSKPPPTSDAAPASTPVPSMPSVRPPSPAQSDSSEEVIIFTGRQNGKASAGTARTAVRQNFDQEGPKDLHATGNRSDPRETAANGNDRPPATATMTQDHDAAVRSFASLSKEKRRGRTKPRRRDQLYDDTTDSDAFLADYMENLRANGELDDDFVTKASGRVVDLAGWQPEDLDDLDNLSTSDEILDKVVQVISKRERPSGVQYLVVWDGQSVDEARWIQHALLTMEGAGPLIAAFEEEEQHVLEYQDRTDSDSEDGGDSGKTSLREGGKNRQVDSSDDEEDELDEDDAIARRIERMSDEQIARLLAKQEELGMGSDELLLFEEPEGDSDYDEDDEMATAMALDVDTDNDAADSYIALGTSSKHSRSSKEKRRTRTLWKTDDEDNEDDELFGAAADYGDFDVMDFDRPSLISKPSKTKKELQVNVSDSEIEASLREQWAADRSKKKVRKQEREELRAQGLLGKRNQRKPDLSARYNEGMSIEDIMGELEEFLSTAWDSRPFPPMDKRNRKMLHEIASKFNLKSKSVGSGKHRFPVLYKTRKTLPFDETLFIRVGRRFFPRMDIKPGKRPKRARGAGGGGGHAGYMEGDAVGASAPEIGIENRGRAMLEKMGWSKGMALGSMDNQGIIEPIAHIVKKSRTGLG